MREAIVIRDNSYYLATYYKKSTEDLVIVFISAGRIAPGEPVEEFCRTIESVSNTSIIFILDRKGLWYNYSDTALLFVELEKISASFLHVAAMGESLGGCGALLSSSRLPKLDRVLAFSPQYSIAPPFINFDGRYEPIGRSIANHRIWHFAQSRNKAIVTIIFGGRDWRDYIHSALYTAHGYSPRCVIDADHNVAAHLKKMDGNMLRELVGKFLDWNAGFELSQDQVLSHLFVKPAVADGCFPDDEVRVQYADKAPEIERLLAERYLKTSGNPLARNVALHKACYQSSTTLWSREFSPEADASGAVDGTITGFYSFHTDADELGPWWTVDLGAIYQIQAVAVHNCLYGGLQVRSQWLRIAIATEADCWKDIYAHSGAEPFGGANGSPLFVILSDEKARFLKVSLDNQNFLHLDEVQVFGHPISAAA